MSPASSALQVDSLLAEPSGNFQIKLSEYELFIMYIYGNTFAIAKVCVC